MGAGTMGTDISAMLSNAGHSVTLVDVKEKALQNARKKHKKIAARLKKAEILKEKEIPSNMTYTNSFEGLKDCIFVIEAVDEDLEVKKSVMGDLEDIISKNCVIATNTSTYTVTEIVKHMEYPNRTVLMHFAYPPISRDFVEVAKGNKTSDKTLDFTLERAKDIDKTPIVPKKEYRGYILNRLLTAGMVATSYEYVEGGKPEEIDATFKELGSPSGIFETLDSRGLDNIYQVCKNLQEAYGERFKIPEKFSKLLEKKIKRGKLGKKTGEGIYKWENGEPEIPEAPADYDMEGIFAALINEGFRVVEDGVANRENVARAFKLAQEPPAGIFELGEMLGYKEVRKKLEVLYDERENELFEPTESLIEKTNH